MVKLPGNSTAFVGWHCDALRLLVATISVAMRRLRWRDGRTGNFTGETVQVGGALKPSFDDALFVFIIKRWL